VAWFRDWGFFQGRREREIFCGIDDGAIKGFTVEAFRFVVIRVVTDEVVKGMGQEGEERDKEEEEAGAVVVIG
jgi:hypothetical protein